MTIAQIRADKRVQSFTKLDPDEWDDGIKYELALEDGYAFSDGSGIQYLGSVKEASDELKDVKELR